MWLAAVSIDLGQSLAELLDLSDPDLRLQDGVTRQLQLSSQRLQECVDEAKRVLLGCGVELTKAEWFNDSWVDNNVASAFKTFDEALERWRELYGSARAQLIDAQDRIRNAHVLKLTRDEEHEQERREREAQRQLSLLRNESRNRDDSDFYPYRYLASEGFLPGYNFPRLPIRAFVATRADRGEYLSQ